MYPGLCGTEFWFLDEGRKGRLPVPSRRSALEIDDGSSTRDDHWGREVEEGVERRSSTSLFLSTLVCDLRPGIGNKNLGPRPMSARGGELFLEWQNWWLNSKTESDSATRRYRRTDSGTFRVKGRAYLGTILGGQLQQLRQGGWERKAAAARASCSRTVMWCWGVGGRGTCAGGGFDIGGVGAEELRWKRWSGGSGGVMVHVTGCGRLHFCSPTEPVPESSVQKRCASRGSEGP
jgi:hypothetical protein